MVRNIHSYTFIHVIFLTLSPSFTKQKRIRPIQRCVSALGRNTGGSKVFQILKRHGKNICNDSRRRPQAPRYMDATIVTVSSLKTITTISFIVMITKIHMLSMSLSFLWVQMSCVFQWSNGSYIGQMVYTVYGNLFVCIFLAFDQLQFLFIETEL